MNETEPSANPQPSPKPEREAACAGAPRSAYTVGRIVRLETLLGRYHLWKITSVHLGAVQAESLVSLQRLDVNPGTAFGQTMMNTIAPLCLLTENPNVVLV
jgi:hypothetical protein